MRHRELLAMSFTSRNINVPNIYISLAGTWRQKNNRGGKKKVKLLTVKTRVYIYVYILHYNISFHIYTRVWAENVWFRFFFPPARASYQTYILLGYSFVLSCINNIAIYLYYTNANRACDCALTDDDDSSVDRERNCMRAIHIYMGVIRLSDLPGQCLQLYTLSVFIFQNWSIKKNLNIKTIQKI